MPPGGPPLGCTGATETASQRVDARECPDAPRGAHSRSPYRSRGCSQPVRHLERPRTADDLRHNASTLAPVARLVCCTHVLDGVLAALRERHDMVHLERRRLPPSRVVDRETTDVAGQTLRPKLLT